MSMNQVYALCSAIFFAVMGWGLLSYGSNAVQFTTFISLFAAGVSQFLAQDDNYGVVRFAWMLSLFAMFVAALALIMFIVRAGVT